MTGGFRQSMSWLHTWCGLFCGWLLCAIMLTGTLSVFREPITRWMQARPTVQLLPLNMVSSSDGDRVVAKALQYFEQHAAGARFWRIEFPEHAGDALQLVWRTGRTTAQAALHPQTGEPLPQPWGRATEGGRHFMSFHYLLHAGLPGYWLVGLVSMCMLVALVSGVVVHRRIFVDFFTFRPGKGQRSWLDAHNATAVLTLPFLFMIVYTGLFIFYTSYMPWPMRTLYGTGERVFQQYQAELLHAAAEPPERARTGEAVAMVPLWPLQQQAQDVLGQSIRAVVIEQPGDRHVTVRFLGRAGGRNGEEVSRTIQNPAGSAAFDGATGKLLQIQRAEPDAPFSTEQVHGVMESLHYARFGGWTIRWLYFLSGLMGTAMVATGTILFTVKRRQKSGQEFGRATTRVYRAIEALNVAAVAGIGLACIGYFYVNRLLPADWPQRAQWEIRGFLTIWLLTLLHASLRAPRQAWVEQVSATTVLCVALPLLNLVTTGQFLISYAQADDWQRMTVEWVALTLGVLLGWGAWRIRYGWRVKSAATVQRNLPGKVWL